MDYTLHFFIFVQTVGLGGTIITIKPCPRSSTDRIRACGAFDGSSILPGSTLERVNKLSSLRVLRVCELKSY